MGLPSADRSAMRCIEARYSDSAAMSLARLASLRHHDGRPLLYEPIAGSFWSEHSDRGSVISIAATMPNIDSTWLDELGRWSRGTSATYIRTHLFRVRTIQRKVAIWSRSRSHAQAVEEEVYAGFGEYCKTDAD